MKIRTAVSTGTAAALALSLSIVLTPPARADDITPGSFNVVQTSRLLDTRTGLGAPKIAVAAHATVTFTATTGISEPVSAVALNITAVSPKVAGYLTVFAAGAARPLASNLNFQPAQNVPNLVITPVGSAGRVSVYNGSGGPVDVLADIHGYFLGGVSTAGAGTFVPAAPQRFLDTRIGLGAAKAQVPATSDVKFTVAGIKGIPADASAVALNVTATGARAAGFVTTYAGAPLPLASSLNFVKGQDRANASLAEIGPDGTISLHNGSASPVDLVADISGYFVGGTPSTDGTFVPSTPVRTFDSRLPGGRPAGALTISKIQIFPADDPTFSTYVKAVVIDVTATQSQAAGFLTTWDGVGPLPSVSSSNFAVGQNVAGSVIVPVNPDGTISIYNGSYGNVDLVVDLNGLMFALPDQVSGARTSAGSLSMSSRAAQLIAQLENAKPAAVPVSVVRTH